MNSTVSGGAQPPEMMPLQGYNLNPGYPGIIGYPAGQPTAPAPFQYTTVNVGAIPPKDHVVWSLCSFVYGNPFCLGLLALICSIKSRDRKVVGDIEGARQHASIARILNIASAIIIAIIFLILIIFYSVLFSMMNRYY